jgi:hypothetical protein
MTAEQIVERPKSRTAGFSQQAEKHGSRKERNKKSREAGIKKNLLNRFFFKLYKIYK